MCYRVNIELCRDTTPIGRFLNVVDCCPRRRWASKKQRPKGFFQRLKGTASNVVQGFTLGAQNAMLDFRRHPKLFGRPSLVRGVVCTETALRNERMSRRKNGQAMISRCYWESNNGSG